MKQIAIILDSDYEDSEYSTPKERLEDHGYSLTIVGVKNGKMLIGKNKKSTAHVDALANDINHDDFDGLLIPGGDSPDHLKDNAAITSFIYKLHQDNMPIAAISHGPVLLVASGIAKGMRLTSCESVKSDLINAGATWINESVVSDQNIITSRKPEDLDQFCYSFIKELNYKNLAGFQ